jgi:hypothetical protein
MTPGIVVLPGKPSGFGLVTADRAAQCARCADVAASLVRTAARLLDSDDKDSDCGDDRARGPHLAQRNECARFVARRAGGVSARSGLRPIAVKFFLESVNRTAGVGDQANSL